MGTLSELGLGTADGALMLVSPPDGVLAEASAMKPRPSIASTLQVAEPARRMAWWPDRRQLDPATLSRFRWMLESAGGEGWLILDPEDEGVDSAALREALAPTQLTIAEERALPRGEFAVRVTP
ncbi:MAG: hypothetical protein IT303_03890 [Dehalococcoidia bacterium]|nr:hypothetical protein [Dehalococcoidia bacterium]